jgi:hypothetical protein
MYCSIAHCIPNFCCLIPERLKGNSWLYNQGYFVVSPCLSHIHHCSKAGEGKDHKEAERDTAGLSTPVSAQKGNH